MVGHIRDRINLRLKAQTLLESKTGLGVIEVIENANSDDYLYFTAVELLYLTEKNMNLFLVGS